MANQAEQLALRGGEFQIKFVDKLAKRKGIERRDDEDHKKEKKENFQDFFDPDDEQNTELEPHWQENEQSEYDQDDEQNEVQNVSQNLEYEQIQQKNMISEGFSVRINKDTEKVELLSLQDNRVIQTISANELMGLISKMDNASGIFVNKKV